MYKNNTDFNEIRSFGNWINSLSPLEFTTLGTIIGYLIANMLTVEEQNSIGNWFELVGQIILTFNAQGSNNLPPSPKQFCDLSNLVNELKNEINSIKEKLPIK